jgi:ActR/RegA family two-component response regulator
MADSHPYYVTYVIYCWSIKVPFLVERKMQTLFNTESAGAGSPNMEVTLMHNTVMPVSAGKMLLVSPSSLTMYQVAKSAHRFDMSVQVCTEVRTALDLVNQQKFDAVTVDLTLGQHATAILRETRSSAANRTAVAFAISGTLDQSADAFRAGSSFVMERPLSFESIRRTLHAAHGLILRERRRYYRCPIAIPVSIRQEGAAAPVYGETSDISEGGMAVRLLTPLTPGVDGIVQFTLPNTRVPIRAEAKVCWCKETGQAGLVFLELSARDSSELQQWVACKFAEQLAPSEVFCTPPPPLTQLIAPAWQELT